MCVCVFLYKSTISQLQMPICCIRPKFGVLKKLFKRPAVGYLCYFKFVHLSTQQSKDTKEDIHFKDVISKN